MASTYWSTLTAALRGRFDFTGEPVLRGGGPALSAGSFALLTMGIIYAGKCVLLNVLCQIIALVLPIGVPWGHVPNLPNIPRWPFDVFFVDMPCLGLASQTVAYEWGAIGIPAIWNGMRNPLLSAMAFAAYATVWLFEGILLCCVLADWSSDGSATPKKGVVRRCARLAAYGTAYWLPLSVILGALSLWSLYQVEWFHAPRYGMLRAMAGSAHLDDGLAIVNTVAFSLSTCCLAAPILIAPPGVRRKRGLVLIVLFVALVLISGAFLDAPRWYAWPMRVLLAGAGK